MLIKAPNDIQAFALGVPFIYDVAAVGSRGWGKSIFAILSSYQYAMAFPGSRIVYLRQSYGSLHDAVINSVQIFTELDRGASLNKSDLHWTFSNLSSMTFAPLADVLQYRRWQGANVQMCIYDECQQFASPELPDLLLSNLRSSSATTRALWLANPGDRGHAWVFERFIKSAPALDGVPFTTDNGRDTVLIRGMISDNPHLPKNYIENLRAATKHDPALFRAWSEGDWHSIGGTAFGDVLSEKNIVAWYPGDYWPERRDSWRLFLSIDWGAAAPAVALLCAQSTDSTRGGDQEQYARSDIVVLDEVSTNLPGELNKGDRSTVGEFCERVKKMCAEWDAPRRGCGDDACFSFHGHERGSLGQEFLDNGLDIVPSGKGRRVDGWATLKERFSNAETHLNRERPSVYINAHRCPYIWQTLKLLVPDPKNREDVQTDGPDHAADALRMGVVWRKPEPARFLPFPFR